MKFPNNIILDTYNSNIINSSQYWIVNYINFFEKKKINFKTFNFFKFKKINKKSKFYSNKFYISYSREDLKNAIQYSFKNHFKNIKTSVLKKIIKNNLKNNKKNVKHSFSKVKININLEKIKNNLQNNSKNNLKISLKKFFSAFNKKFKKINNKNIKYSITTQNFDINFLRKEKIYTKLKYSRVPQYDIVSGGVAAIFAGFLGFLVCEKFGFELLDSGDFYFIFMYLVFFFFFLRLIIKIISFKETEWNFFSYKWLLLYIEILINFLNYFIKKLIKN